MHVCACQFVCLNILSSLKAEQTFFFFCTSRWSFVFTLVLILQFLQENNQTKLQFHFSKGKRGQRKAALDNNYDNLVSKLTRAVSSGVCLVVG